MQRWLYILALLAFALPASARITKLSHADHVALVEGEAHARMIRSVREIPASVIEACRAIVTDRECHIAEPGANYQAGDTIGLDKHLPPRQLIWAAHIPGYYILHYKMGGFAPSYLVMVFSFHETGHAKHVWHAQTAYPRHGPYLAFKDYRSFLLALKIEELNDAMDHHFNRF